MRELVLLLFSGLLLAVCLRPLLKPVPKRDVSEDWVREDDRRRAAFGYEGVSHSGKFKR